ncbi:ThuA domain-containing protein [Actinophytocola oryzae]|uniref:Glucose/arabinose dehydrogenase n=1 Tax=Actinophytocola oryzae TaxID=502181 RepID=A0A4R7VV01_9PSEU|nr:ThuA domain-containing protein [Actinophytocola oryzae]TDV53672.1 glucose/arabinose dehydrogenase [Actinophytocola oryzae]
MSRHPRRGLSLLAVLSMLVALLVAPPAQAQAFAVLVFSKTAGFRHDSIPAGVAAIQQLGQQNGFTVDATEDATTFTDANLARYQAVVWLSTTGDVLNADQQAAFERYIRAGGGYAGVHAAADTEYDWSWYGRLVGAYFNSHPAVQQATVKVEDHAHPATAALPDRWTRTDEWYNFRTSPRSNVHVLASVDETSYQPGAGAMGADHPTAWCQDFDGGRSWYTGGGHSQESFADPRFLSHLLGGIRTAAGAQAADCGATKTSGFEKVTLDANTSNPMELDVAPDGSVFYVERDGRLRIVKPDTNSTVTAGTLPVFTGNEDGLLGITLDPAFAANRWVYLYYAPNGGAARNVLSRFTMNGDTLDLASEKILLTVGTQRNTCCHAGGTMTFDSAGNLYLATGDNTNPFESDGYAPLDERAGRADFDAQRSAGNTNDLRGKVIRIRPQADGTYTVPAGNLFSPGTAQTRAEIYAMGFRNPFRIGVDPKTNVLYVADYGPDAGQANPDRGPGNTVEWNIVSQAGNYGWPYCTGANAPYREYTFPSGPAGPAYDCAAPVNNSPNNTGLRNLPPAIAATVDYDYDGNPRFPELGGGGAPMAGPVYRYDPALASDRKWPAYYDGKAIFGEWNQSKLYTMQVSADGEQLVDINQLLTGMSTIRPMDFDFGPDGALYLIEWGTGFGGNNDDSGIYRIDYRSGGRAPVATASGTPTSGQAPLTVQFSSAGSGDPDGQPVTYSWDFGDGGTSTAANPSHTFTANGQYNVQLTVTDPDGRTGVANVPVSVGNTAPTVRLTAPADGGFFDWGDRVNFTVQVTDPEDGAVDCSRVVLQYSFGHDEHAHPIQQYHGCSGTVQTSLESGHGADANVFGVLEASYVDNGGLAGRSLVRLNSKRKQAEHFAATGRVAGSTAGGDPGVQRETTGDTAGGVQNIGFIEDGDWWSVDPANLSGIQQVRLRAASGGTGGRVEIHGGSPTGALLGTVTVPATGGWQTYTDVTTTVSTSSGPLFFVARPPTGTANGGGLLNVNWMDFVGQGVTGPTAPTLSQNVHLFYYPWYGASNGAYRHWQQGGHTPPNDIGANFYPKAGPYDSGDFAGVVDQHMRWTAQSGAGVLVYSWWGQGSYEDGLVQGVMDAAARYGIKIAWHLEPYAGRTAASTVADIDYINQRYGSHPAFYRSAEHGNRTAFYVFQSLDIPDDDWAALDAVTGNNIVLAQTTDTSRIDHFSGLYTYDAIAGATAPGWEQAGEYAKANNLVWAPSVGPGYLDDRAVPGNTTPTLDRANGGTYDLEWTNALDPTKSGVPTWVSVTSFNEWHEGSVLEPASSTPPTGFGYQTFDGAYGRTGAAAETAYLDRTAYWATEFEQRRGGVSPNTNLALNRPAVADSQCAASEGPEKAVNGSVTGGNADKWCSLGASKWLRVDLGTPRQLGRFVVKHAGAGNESTAFNTRDFDLQTSNDGQTWTTVFAARGNTANTSTHVITPTTARYVRVDVLVPTQNSDTAARIYELEVYAS